MNKKYGITGLILIIILATVMISGCIGDDTPTNDKFTNTVIFQGITFYLPDGYVSIDKSSDRTVIYEIYSDDGGNKNAIGLFYYPLVSKSQVLSNLKSDSRYSNIDNSASYGGYSGYSAEFTGSIGEEAKIFVFEKGGKTFAITLSSGFNFGEYIPKIMGS